MGKLNKDNLRKTYYYLKKNGWKNTIYAVRERLEKKDTDSYTYVAPSEKELQDQRLRTWENPLTFSILVPLYRTGTGYFTEMVESVLAQTYPYFELILLDAGGEGYEQELKQAGHPTLQELTVGYGDGRVIYHKLAENQGIAENTNAGLELATGDYIVLLDHDDLLTADALYEMAAAIERKTKSGVEPLMLYSDEDKCDGEAKRFYEPHYKLDFNLDLLLTNNYICHLTVIKTALFRELKLRGAYNGAQDFDLVLRVAAQGMGQQERVVHVAKILYHWRCHTDSTAANPASKMYAYEAGKRAVEDFVAKQGWNARVEHLKHLGFYRITYQGEIFQQRPQVGAVGGSILGAAGKLVGGLRDSHGRVVYAGLKHGFSGYMNRAALVQQAPVLDVRCIRVNPACSSIVEQVRNEFGMSQKQWEALCQPDTTVDVKEISIRLSEALKEAGYVLIWDPWWER